MLRTERYVITGIIYDLNGLRSATDFDLCKMTIERASRKLQDLIDDDDFYRMKKESEKNNA